MDMDVRNLSGMHMAASQHMAKARKGRDGDGHPFAGAVLMPGLVAAGGQLRSMLPLLFAEEQRILIDAGETLICEGDGADAVYFVVSGLLRCTKVLADGRRQIFAFCDPNDLVGIFTAEREYAYSVEGITSSAVLRANRSHFLDVAMRSPEVSRQLLSLAAREHSIAQERMLLLGRKTARERICSFLMERRRDDGSLELVMSRKDIADYLGLTVETVSRTFGRLGSEGLIRKTGPRRVEVTELAARLCAMPGRTGAAGHDQAPRFSPPVSPPLEGWHNGERGSPA